MLFQNQVYTSKVRCYIEIIMQKLSLKYVKSQVLTFEALTCYMADMERRGQVGKGRLQCFQRA